MENDREVLKKRAIEAGFVLAVKRVIVQFIFTLSNIFLARLLFPEDFGVAAILGFINNLFIVFSDIGFGPSLVQKKDQVDRNDLTTAFSVQLILSVGVILTIFFLAPLISGFYGLGERGTFLFRLNSLIFLFGPIKTTCGSLLERNLKYYKLAVIELFQLFATMLTTVILAIYGFGVLSFVLGALMGYLVAAVLYFSISPWKVGIKIVLKNLKVLTLFGLPLQSGVILGLFSGSLIFLYLGKVVGAENFGYFQFSLSFAVMPLAISDLLSRILFPLGSRVQRDKVFFGKIIERAIMITSLTALPILFLIAALAPSIIHFIYTDRWMPALPAVYIGIVVGTASAFFGVMTQLLLSRGISKVGRNISFVLAILTWVLAPLLIKEFNFLGMNLTNLILSFSGIIFYIKLRQEVKFDFVRNFFPFLIYAVASGLCAYLLNMILPRIFISLVISLLVSGVFYITLVWKFSGSRILTDFKFLTKYYSRFLFLRSLR